MWREIINHRKYIGAGVKWCIGDGRKVCFLTDYWVNMVSLVSFMDGNNLQYINLEAKVHDFINHETKKWNIHSISNILPLNVIADIKAKHIPCSPIEDRILRGFSRDEKFTLKSTTWAMRKPSVHPIYKILNWLWKLNLFPKIKVFLWLVLIEALPTCEFFIYRRIEITNTCHLCNGSSENIDHIFKQCFFCSRNLGLY